MVTIRLCFAVAALVATSAQGATIPLTPGVMHTESFDSILNPVPADNTTQASPGLPTGWVYAEIGTAANGLYRIHNGSSTTSDTYLAGATGSAERAIGAMRNTNLYTLIGAQFTNASDQTITQVQIAYRGELWRLSNNGTWRDTEAERDKMDLQVSNSTNAFEIASSSPGMWLDVDELDFKTWDLLDQNPDLFTEVTGAKNGNSAEYSETYSHTFDLTLAPGATMWVRWLDYDAGGLDDLTAIDDFSITLIVPEPATAALLGLAGLLTARRRRA